MLSSYQSKSLPYSYKIFVGREREISELTFMLDFSSTSDADIRIVSIVGPPGFGKSTLAIHLGDEMVKQRVEVHYVDMAEHHEQDIETILAEKILNAAECTFSSLTFSNLLKWLQSLSWNSLILIDNCDDILQGMKDSFFDALQKIVEKTPRVKVLITTREITTHIKYVRRYPVHKIHTSAACKLLKKILPPSINLTTVETEKIATLTGNVPLALQIIGALFSLPNPPSPQFIIDKLDSRPIPVLSQDELPQSENVNASISLSYQHLDPELREVSQFLANFPGSFTLEAANAIFMEDLILPSTISSDTNSTTVTNTLTSLVHRSLLEFDSHTGRYTFHRLIKEFFREMQPRNKTNEEFILKFQLYYSSLLIQTIDLFDKDYKKALHDLQKEKHNYQTILAHLREKHFEEQAFIQMLVAISKAQLHGGRLLSLYFNEEQIMYSLKSALEYITNETNLLQSFHTSHTYKGLSSNSFALYVVTLLYEAAKLERTLLGREEALRAYESRKHLIDTVMSNTSELEVHRKLAKLHNVLGNYKEEKDCHEKIFSLEQRDKLKRCVVRRDPNGQYHVSSCSYYTIADMHYKSGNIEAAAEFFELSYKTEQNAGINQLELLVDLVRVYTDLNYFDKKEQYAKELQEMLQSDSLNVSEIYTSRESLISIVGELKAYKQYSIADDLDTKILEATIDIEKQADHMKCSKLSESIKVVKYYFKERDYKRTVQLGRVLLDSQKTCIKHPYIIFSESIEVKAMMAKAMFFSGNFSQGMDEMEDVISLIAPNPIFHERELFEFCLYLIPRLRHIVTCYPWVKSYPSSVAKFLMYVVFVIPLDPYSSEVQVEYPSPAKSTVPELTMLSDSKQIVPTQTSLQWMNRIQYEAPNVRENIVWAVRVFSTIVRFLLQFNSIRLLVNILLVLIRLYLFCVIFFVIAIPLVWSTSLCVFHALSWILLGLMLTYPGHLLFPPVLTAVNFMFTCNHFLFRYVEIPYVCFFSYILFGVDFCTWQKAVGFVHTMW